MSDADTTQQMEPETSAPEEAQVVDLTDLEDEDEEENVYVVSKIVDVKAYKKEMMLKFKVRWDGFTSANDTWETEENLSEEPCVAEQVRRFKEENKEKLAAEQAKLTAMPPKRKSKRKPTWEYVEVPEEKNKTQLSLSQEQPTDDMITPREMCETDEFYGESAGAVKGEVKKLFDPTHKNTPTELVLAQMNTNERVTRRQMKNLISNASSRSNSIGRDSESPAPTPSPAAPSPSTSKDLPSSSGATTTGKPRGRPRKPKAPPKIVKKRTIADVSDLYDDEVTTEVHIDDGKPIESISPSPVGDILPSTSASIFPIDHDENMDVSATDSNQLNEANEAGNDSAPQEAAEDLLAGLTLHNGPIDLTMIHNEYNSMMLATRKRLQPKEFRFARDIINLLSSNDFDAFAVQELFENLSNTQLQSIFSWKDSATGYNILHWVCVNLKCNGCHAADKITNILCSFCLDNFRVPDSPVHLTRQLDQMGSIPLHIAVEKGQLCRASHLLLHRSSINVQNRKQQTPLMIAYGSNHAKMVKLLLHYGADFATLERQEMSEFEEVNEYTSIIRTARFCEGPEFRFHLPHEHFVLPSDDYAYVISLHVCRFYGDDPNQWIARCGAGLAQQSAPIFNGKGLTVEFAQYLPHPMFYFVDPVPGENILDLQISMRELEKDILGCQMLLVRRVPEHHIDELMPSSSGLEVAPLVGIL